MHGRDGHATIHIYSGHRSLQLTGCLMPNTIFAKIIRKEIPAKIAYEDDTYIAIHDVKPAAPVHLLIKDMGETPMPRKSFSHNRTARSDDDLQKPLTLARRHIELLQRCLEVSRQGIEFRVRDLHAGVRGDHVLAVIFHRTVGRGTD